MRTASNIPSALPIVPLATVGGALVVHADRFNADGSHVLGILLGVLGLALIIAACSRVGAISKAREI